MAKNALSLMKSAQGICLRVGPAPVAADIALSIGTTNGVISGSSEGASAIPNAISDGSDEIGSYRSRSFGFDHTQGEGPYSRRSSHAELTVRCYPGRGVAVGCVNVRTESDLLPERAARVTFGCLPRLKRYLAIHNQVSDTWTRPYWDTDISNLPGRTHFLLWERNPGGYCFLALPVSGGFRGDMNLDDGRLGVDLVSHDAALRKCEAVPFVLGVGNDPFELVRRVYSVGMTAAGRPGSLRWEKPYPDVFEFIGWCTWDAFYKEVTAEGIFRKLEHFQSAGFPARFVLIDCGWPETTNEKLVSFDADPTRFPGGLKALAGKAKEEFGVRWLGVWHTLNGWWHGVDQESEIALRYSDSLLPTKADQLIPYPEPRKGLGFWHAWHSYLRKQGVAFVKVDNQSPLWRLTRYMIPVAEAAKGAQYALQASAALNLGGRIINCMCMIPEMAWHWTLSNVSRNSCDFIPSRHERDRLMAWQSAYNALWNSNFAWPDWDMFWSQHPHAEYHAALRAVSGGPVYFSDRADEGNYSILWPLIDSDGKLLRCDQPALPTRDCLFADPVRNHVPLKIWNRIGDGGVLCAVHACETDEPVRGDFRPQDVEGLEGERFAVREFFSGEARVLGPEDRWEVELQPFEARYYVIVSIVDGFAAIGLSGKYNSPKTVRSVVRAGRTAAVGLIEGGVFLAYCREKPEGVSGKKPLAFEWLDGWLRVAVSEGDHDVVIEW